MSQNMPEDLDYSLPAEIRDQIESNLPDLFSGRYKSVLYVGANHLRQHFLEDFVKGFDKVAVLEIFPENIEKIRKRYSQPNVRLVQGDVRDANKIFAETFDVCFFWHGPEHLEKSETAKVLGMLESMTNEIIVLGMPYGHYEQGPEYGNEHESHKWAIYPKDLDRMGYSTNTMGKPDDTLSNMMAWKHIQVIPHQS